MLQKRLKINGSTILHLSFDHYLNFMYFTAFFLSLGYIVFLTSLLSFFLFSNNYNAL
ncbi:hypothetical protein HCUR_00228 [Holospora curviuscula]|uniref:Uncharacterized protein n=1 Tax=Holospora curviuscula TaxID=1082868 RepID=A0A2S5RE39_9PROT|nr:hypothetical protein HCUR_00228 [Holospora curviuscula]